MQDFIITPEKENTKTKLKKFIVDLVTSLKDAIVALLWAMVGITIYLTFAPILWKTYDKFLDGIGLLFHNLFN